MGNDIMGARSSMPAWSKIDNRPIFYKREVIYIDGNNKNSKLSLQCSISKSGKKEHLNIWNIGFDVTKFEEICQNKASMITNLYYLDSQEIVRRSTQYHSETIGYLIIERLDRSKI